MALIEVQVPDIGDFDEVGVIEVLVKAGDTVKVEQSLITVESDKASMEIPSSAAGVVKELKVKLGDKVAKGSVILTVEADAAAAPAPAAAAAARAGDGGPALQPAAKQHPDASAGDASPTAATFGGGQLSRMTSFSSVLPAQVAARAGSRGGPTFVDAAGGGPDAALWARSFQHSQQVGAGLQQREGTCL